MSQAARAAIETVTPAADAKGITIADDIPDAADVITADASRLQQIIWNLLANAVKFTPKGGRVVLRVFRDDSDACVSVQDNGEGIRPELLGAVFEPFQQADSSTTRRHGGLGLGLSIVKQLVTAHGGSVSAESEGPGKGSTFTARLPVRAIASVDPEPARLSSTGDHDPLVAISASARLDGLRVLVVDDEPDSRMLVREILQLHGAVVEVAGSPTEARAKLDDARPDVIVSDIGMPDEDGYAFIRQLRASGGRTPAIALTAYASQHDAERAFVAGFQKHVIKPVEPAKLVSVVANLGGRSL